MAGLAVLRAALDRDGTAEVRVRTVGLPFAAVMTAVLSDDYVRVRADGLTFAVRREDVQLAAAGAPAGEDAP